MDRTACVRLWFGLSFSYSLCLTMSMVHGHGIRCERTKPVHCYFGFVYVIDIDFWEGIMWEDYLCLLFDCFVGNLVFSSIRRIDPKQKTGSNTFRWRRCNHRIRIDLITIWFLSIWSKQYLLNNWENAMRPIYRSDVKEDLYDIAYSQSINLSRLSFILRCISLESWIRPIKRKRNAWTQVID